MEAGDVKVVHFIPGRVRLKVPQLKRSPELKESMEAAFAAIPGVAGIEVNALTGSVLLSYDPRSITRKESAQALSEAIRTFFPNLDPAEILAWLGVPAT